VQTASIFYWKPFYYERHPTAVLNQFASVLIPNFSFAGFANQVFSFAAD